MQFDHYVKVFLETNAWQVEAVQTRDPKSIHLIAVKDSLRWGILLSPDLNRVLGPEYVQSAYQSSEALFCPQTALITQGSFTDEARKLAESLDPPVMLIDRANFFRAARILDLVPEEAPPAKSNRTVWALAALGVFFVAAGIGSYWLLDSAPVPKAVAEAASVPAVATPEPTPGPDNTLTDYEKSEGWSLLFDGRSSKGWKNSKNKRLNLLVTDGTLNPSGAGETFIFHEKVFGDFLLSLDYKISKGFDHGILLRTFPLASEWSVRNNATEVSIADKAEGGYQDAGGIYDFVKPGANAARPAGEWNHLVIRCYKNFTEVTLNNALVTTIDWNLWNKPNVRPDGSPHRLSFPLGKRARKGYIGLPDPGKPSWYKNIKVRPLKEGGL